MNVKLEYKKVRERVDDYFNLLSFSGYVKSSVLDNMLLYLFAYDFSRELWLLLDAEDLAAINDVVERIFGKGCCLFPYDANMRIDMNAGEIGYMGIPEFRADDADRLVRVSENGTIREDEI